MPDFFGTGIRDEFFQVKIKEMAVKLASNKKPIIKECFLDVFGFSRERPRHVSSAVGWNS